MTSCLDGAVPKNTSLMPDKDPVPLRSSPFRDEELSFPCLYLSSDEWEQLPRRMDDPFFRSVNENNFKALELLRDWERKSPMPTWSRRPLKCRLMRNVVAWFMTRDEEHLTAARQTLEAICNSKQWFANRPEIGLRSADLATAELTHALSFGYDALYNYLTEQERERYVQTLVEKGLAAYLTGIELEDWWIRSDFNWNSALHGCAGVAAIAIRNHDRALSDRVLEETLKGLPYLIDAFSEDGGYIEGIMYLGTAVGHLTDFFVPYERLTGNDLGLASNKSLEDTLGFKAQMYGGDDKPYNFSDVEEGVAPLGISHGFVWARTFDRPDIAGYTERHLSSWRDLALFYDVESLWLREPYQPSEPAPAERLRHFRGIDWLTWRGEQSWLAFRGGWNGGNHDNDDLGNFILGFEGERFLHDPGYGPSLASQHNCVTIRRHEQTDDAVAPIVKLQDFGDGFYLLCDIREAFPHILEHYFRHLLLIGDRHLLLLDDIKGRDDRRINNRGYLQSRIGFTETEDGYCVPGEDNTMKIRWLSDVGHISVDEWRPRDSVMHRLEWVNAYHRIQSVQPILLSFEEAEYESQLDEEGFQLELNGQCYKFLYNGGCLEFVGG